MKGLIIGGAVIFGVIIGLWPHGLMRPKPAWWRWLATIALTATVLLALGVPTGGDFTSAIEGTMARGEKSTVAVYGLITAIHGDVVVMRDCFNKVDSVLGVAAIVRDEKLATGQFVILDATFDRSAKHFVARRHVATNPILTLPLVPGLDEQARNIYFHVPCAWLAQLAWFVACAYAVVSLRRRRPEDDLRATAAAGLGLLFCILATITGSIWARFNWNSFWNWDPRQIAIFVVLVIFGAYFALRSAVPNEEQRSRLSAVYLILMLLPVVFFIFIFPRITVGLHPGAIDPSTQAGSDGGPVFAVNGLNPTKQAIFGLSFFSFSLLFFWMLNLSVRTQLVALRRRMASAAATTGPRNLAVTPIGADGDHQP